VRILAKAGAVAVAVSAGLALTACDSGSSTTSAAGSSPASPSSPAGASVAAAASPAAGSSSAASGGSGTSGNSGSTAGGSGACTASQLSASVGNATGGIEHVLTVNLVNKGQASCTMEGYPGVDAVGTDMDNGSRTQVSIPRSSHGLTVQKFTLAPGDGAQFSVAYQPAGNSSFEFDPTSLVVTPPNTYQSFTLPLSGLGYKVTFSWDNSNNKLTGESVSPVQAGGAHQ